MKEFVISEAKAETAVLVGLITKEQDEAKTKEYLDELEFLADTSGAVKVKRFTQKVGGPNQTTYVAAVNSRKSRHISNNAKMPMTTGWMLRMHRCGQRDCWMRPTPLNQSVW